MNKNKVLWESLITAGVESENSRIAKAEAEGNSAALLFTKGKMNDIIKAIDDEDFSLFTTTCLGAGITDTDTIQHMWDATMGSINAQSARPCW